MSKQKLVPFTLIALLIVVWISTFRFLRNGKFNFVQGHWRPKEPKMIESRETFENSNDPAITSFLEEIKSDGTRTTEYSLDIYNLGKLFGYITIPAPGNGGNFFLFAGSTANLKWTDPPSYQTRHEFNLLSFSDPVTVIGTDNNFEDGVSIEWFVPENLSGVEIVSIAYSPTGNISYYAIGAFHLQTLVPWL